MGLGPEVGAGNDAGRAGMYVRLDTRYLSLEST